MIYYHSKLSPFRKKCKNNEQAISTPVIGSTYVYTRRSSPQPVGATIAVTIKPRPH